MCEIAIRRRAITIVAAVYGGLSAVCFLASLATWTRPIVEHAWAYLWVLGPPSLLVYGSDYIAIYAAGTAVCAGCAWCTAYCLRREWGGALVFLVLGVLMWGLWGLLVYVPIA